MNPADLKVRGRIYDLRNGCLKRLEEVERWFQEIEHIAFVPRCKPEQEWYRRILAGALYGYVPEKLEHHMIEHSTVYGIIDDMLDQIGDILQSVETHKDLDAVYRNFRAEQVRERLQTQGIAPTWTDTDHEEVQKAIEMLDPRRQEVLRLYYCDQDVTRKEIGRRLGISGTRVSDLMRSAIKYKLSSIVRARGLDRLFECPMSLPPVDLIRSTTVNPVVMAVLFFSWDNMPVSVRTANCLMNGGYTYIVDAIMNPWPLLIMKAKNFGRKSLKEVHSALAEISTRHNVVITLNMWETFSEEQRIAISAERAKK